MFFALGILGGYSALNVFLHRTRRTRHERQVYAWSVCALVFSVLAYFALLGLSL